MHCLVPTKGLMSSAILKALCSSLSCVMARQSSDMSKLRSELTKARSVVILTGAGVSAESGIATFRGAGGLWRKYQAASLATPEAFYTSPSLVWEFYHYRREAARTAKPNAAHIAIANYEEKQNSMDKTVTVITQNVDGLHLRAGTKNLIELHGNLYKTRCTKCKEVLVNNESPLCESPLQRVTSQRDLGVLMDPKLTFHDHIAKVCRAAYRTLGFVMRQAYHLCSIEAIKALAGRGAPDENVVGSDVPVKSLPHCKKPGCSALLRPHIVWFGENLDTSILDQAHRAMEACDVCLVVGTSSVVYPAAMFAPEAAARGATVAEFNLEPTPSTRQFHYYFEGPCGTTLPQALDQLKMS